MGVCKSCHRPQLTRGGLPEDKEGKCLGIGTVDCYVAELARVRVIAVAAYRLAVTAPGTPSHPHRYEAMRKAAMKLYGEE